VRIAFTLGAVARVSLAMLVGFGALAIAAPAAAADGSSGVPEEVAEYFESGLLPRLADLYGPGTDGAAGIDFADETTSVGTITRVMVWTDEFRAGADTDLAVELSNTWVAPITSGEVADEAEADAAEGSDPAEVEKLGLAVVWISPYTNEPELAHFTPSEILGPALAKAPDESMLVHDEEYDAWYALAGDQLMPLAQGGEAVSGAPLSLTEAQPTLWKQLETLPESGDNNGFVVAGLTLAFVVVLLAIFVLVPDRRPAVTDPEAALGFGPSDSER